ncbi:MAG: zinc-ribbon domain-containing protein [Lachnospiraceae bacterium]|nr:zinc-ribbon domain-containing protein [Lachnospiraceae bacterium]
MKAVKISFADKYPDLVSEWSDRNEMEPDHISYGSNKKVWWKGSCGHEWEAIVKNRGTGHGCPICSSNLIIPGVNDFKSRHPELMPEWSEKNTLDPSTIGEFANRTAIWRCRSGHEWKARIADRSKGHGCKKCADIAATKPENHIPKKKRIPLRNFSYTFMRQIPKASILYYLDKACEKYRINDDSIIGIPIKLYLPDKKTAIEFYKPHGNIGISYTEEWVKNDLCRRNHINMIRLLEKKCKAFDNCICLTYEGYSLEIMDILIKKVFALIRIEADMDIIRDIFNIALLWEQSYKDM